MTPAWVCFDYRPEDIALDAYAGPDRRRRAAVPDARADGRQLRGDRLGLAQGRRARRARPRSQAEKWSRHPHRDRRVVRADPRAQQHQPGRADGRPRVLARLQAGEARPARRVHAGLRPGHAADDRARAASSRSRKALRRGRGRSCRRPTRRRGPMTMAEKILRARTSSGDGPALRASRATRSSCAVDGGYSPRVHDRAGRTTSSSRSTAPATASRTRASSRSSRTTCIYADGRAAHGALRRPRSRRCATCSASSSARPACATTPREDGVSPGICHQVAREQFIEPGDFIQATDSHTCMGGGDNALAYGVGRDRVRGARPLGLHVRRGARVDPLRAARARCAPGVTAKDVMLHILAHLREARRTRSTA